MLLGSQARGQQSFDEFHESLRSENPPDTKFTFRLADPHPYREGELIPIEAAFRAPERRYQFAGVLLDPPQDCGSFEKPCWNLNQLTFARNDPLLSLGHVERPFSTDLNLYVPRLPPGRYRAALLARLTVLAAKTPDRTVWGYAEPRQYAVSNLVEFEVVPATVAWVRGAIDECIAALNAPYLGDRDFETRRRAARRLRFIQHPLAWPVSLDLLGKSENELLAGLVEAPEHRAVCHLMQSRIGAASQHVSDYYLSRMAWICQLADLPAPPEIGLKTPEAEKTRQEWFRQTRAFETDLLDRANATLAASLPSKTPEVKGVAIDTLLRRAQHLVLNERERPSPAWLPQVRREVLRSFLDLEPVRQRELLDSYWAHLRGPEFVPLVENLLERKEGLCTSQEMFRILMRRLSDLDPAKVHARLLAMLKAADPRLDAVTLQLLPPEAVPPMDSFLIDALTAARDGTRGDPNVAMTAIALYATSEALPQVRAIYESQEKLCQPELMAYFLRVAPDYADRVFRSHPWDLHAPPPACTLQYFEWTARLVMHPVLEKYMIAALMHSDTAVKRAAAISLGKYGGNDAQAALWEVLRYFHEYWKDRPAELYKYADSLSLEAGIRNALARAKNWRVDEAGLRLIESLCISERCRADTQMDLRDANRRP